MLYLRVLATKVAVVTWLSRMRRTRSRNVTKFEGPDIAETWASCLFVFCPIFDLRLNLEGQRIVHSASIYWIQVLVFCTDAFCGSVRTVILQWRRVSKTSAPQLVSLFLFILSEYGRNRVHLTSFPRTTRVRSDL